jgi:hypothetical protein
MQKSVRKAKKTSPKQIAKKFCAKLRKISYEKCNVHFKKFQFFLLMPALVSLANYPICIPNLMPPPPPKDHEKGASKRAIERNGLTSMGNCKRFGVENLLCIDSNLHMLEFCSARIASFLHGLEFLCGENCKFFCRG